MKFSILISSYNKGNYIEKCIKSCLAQSNKNLEIIVVDNYSHDQSCKMIQNEFPQVHLIKNNKNFGFSKEFSFSGCGIFCQNGNVQPWRFD